MITNLEKGPEEGTVVVTITCPFCDQQSKVTADTEGFQRWMAGELIQNALPDLSVNDRELLMSGAHSTCFDEAFKE
jgi:hypothetical protein